MALRNPSFEDAGEHAGEAAHWILTAVTSREQIAGFGLPPRAWEDFERWFVLWPSLEDVAVVRAFFDRAVEGYEDFDEGWANSGYLYELLPALLVTCGFGGRSVEDCAAGWDNEPYLRDWERVPSAAAAFSSEEAESFEARWTHAPYAQTWEDVVSFSARFDVGARPIEDFESAWTSTRTL